jgi:gliding motility-associated-like protein
LFIPTAFSPNNDGVNDLFRIKGVPKEQFDTYYLQIFNRWGQLVFISSNPEESWNGIFNGKPSETGNYYWSLYYKLSNLNYKILKGDIMLMR